MVTVYTRGTELKLMQDAIAIAVPHYRLWDGRLKTL